MSSELERRLEGVFADAPEPDPGAGEEALQRALIALRPVATPRRALRAGVLAFAAAVVLLVIAAGSLAAAGALHVSFGAKAKPRPVTTQLSLPKGANGIAAIVDGRLSVVTRTGFRLQVQASAAALSPHALFVAAGIGHSLVAMAPSGRRAWSHQAGGTVVAIAWAPDAIRIAYVVRAGHRFVLHVIWGTGTHDMTIDRSVRPVRPSWQADSLAFAYVGVGGRAIVYDLGHSSRHVVAGSPSDVSQLAFSPTASQLALLSAGRVGVAARGRTELMLRGRLPVTGIGWLSPDLLAESAGSYVLVEPIGILPAYRPLRAGGRVVALTADGRKFAAVVAQGSPRLVVGTRTQLRTVLVLPRRAAVGGVDLG